MGFQMKRFLQGTDDDDGHGYSDRGSNYKNVKQERVDRQLKKFGSYVDFVRIKDYEDTKIKLHFSHFKILDKRRITCFRDEPHICENKIDNVINLL